MQGVVGGRLLFKAGRGEIDRRQEVELCGFKWPPFMAFSSFFFTPLGSNEEIHKRKIFFTVIDHEIRVSLLFFHKVHGATPNIKSFYFQGLNFRELFELGWIATVILYI